MAKFLSLFSSSSGNCHYIESEKTAILIDAGRSAKQIALALKARNIDPDRVEALFVTHEHGDHVCGVRVFSSRHNVPVYATEGTAAGMRYRGFTDSKTPVHIISEAVEIGDMKITPFATSHDTFEPCGYTVEFADGKKLAICTDLGIMTEEVSTALAGSDLVLIESNHEFSMLMNGSYPYPLKRRIAGEKGHLNNDDCAAEVVKLVKNGTKTILLGHLSEENNTPENAYQTTLGALESAGFKSGEDFTLTVLPPENTKKAVEF